MVVARRLPEYEEGKDGPYETSKRRLQVFKRIFRGMPEWRSLMETGEVGDVIKTVDGEDVYYYDLLIGLDSLPRRQKQAFVLICLQSFTESDATAVMLPGSRWTTPVQQYSDMALARMVRAYDEKQNGTWDPRKHKPREKQQDKEKTGE
ncbi:MAG: hypothetical protein LC118_17395 [Dehalococcoidia bacterium]|nr:hypothetical protein [Dehalococcoidia bacterium]